MPTASWYFDFLSPYSYLQCMTLHRLPPWLKIEYRPVVFAGMLLAWGTKGPVEVPARRTFTYRQVLWLAKRNGIPMKLPPAHPFNPVSVLRLALALDCDPTAIRRIFEFIWKEGRNVSDRDEFAALVRSLGAESAAKRISDPNIKDQLHENGKEAIEAGAFGVPTFIIDGEIFWGFDATDMVIDYLADPSMLRSGEMARAATLPEGVRRSRDT
jgi:2-hydroxychromene-2-carboxylate isomerase